MSRNGAMRLPCFNSLSVGLSATQHFVEVTVVVPSALKSSQATFFSSVGKPKQLLSISPKAIKHHFSLKGLFSLFAALR